MAPPQQASLLGAGPGFAASLPPHGPLSLSAQGSPGGVTSMGGDVHLSPSPSHVESTRLRPQPQHSLGHITTLKRVLARLRGRHCCPSQV